MPIDLMPKCRKCNKTLDVSNMRALPEGRGFECRDCNLNNNQTKIKSNDKIIPFASEKNFFMKRQLRCESCNYKFSVNADKYVKKCPYCGRNSVVDLIEETAEDIVKKS